MNRLVPAIENPHDARHIEQMSPDPNLMPCNHDKLMRIGFMSALAIAIHNIPESIAVAIPVYCATRSSRKTFRWSFFSGLAEPLDAVISYLILMPFLNNLTMGIMFVITAGIMIFISLDELLPTAHEYGSPHLAIFGLIGGMMIMAISLQLF